MAQGGLLRPLNDVLGLPDVFPHLEGCLEDALTPDALLHGYRHSVAGAVGFTPQRELALTLTDQPPAFYSSTSLSYWRKSLRQQLQGPARHLAAKRKAHVLYGQPIAATGRDAGSNAVPAAGGTSLSASGLASLPPPRFPLPSSRGPGGKEGGEAGAGEQLAAAGAPPLRTLGGGDGAQLPLSLPFTRQFEVLAEAGVPLPRALWLLRVSALNRARPAGWCGASDAQQRSRQLTEDLLAFLEAAAAAQTAGPGVAAGRPPRPAPAAAAVQGEELSLGVVGRGAAGSQDRPLTDWQYGLQLAGHCCSAGLLDGAKVAQWAASVRVLLPLPPAARREVLALLQQCLRATPLAQQQVLALAELCLKSAEAAAATGTSAGAAAASPAAASRSDQQQRGQQPQQVQRARRRQEAEELRGLLLLAVQQLLSLHPAALVAADESLLQPLQLTGGWSGSASSAALVGGEVKAARQRLSRSLHARVLHWTDDKAMQLLDAQLLRGASMAEATSALRKLVSLQPGAEAGDPARNGATAEATRLICEWAVAAPPADFGAALARAAARPEVQGQQQQQQRRQQWQAEEQRDGPAAMVSERVLYGLSLLQALQADQQQQQQQAPGQGQQIQESDRASTAATPLQGALQRWLDRCGAQAQQQQWQRQRVLYLALLLAEAGLLCPAALLQSLLASGALHTAAVPAAQPGGEDGTATECSFQLELLRQLHPLLEYPTLAGTASSGGSRAWTLPRLRYAAARDAVLLQSALAAGRGSSPGAHARPARDSAGCEDKGWEKMLRASSDDCDTQSSNSSSGGTPGAGQARQPQLVWHDPALRDLQGQLLALLGLSQPLPAAAADARPGAAAALEGLLQRVQRLEPWQQRHTATMLLAAAKGFLASTDSGGRAAGGRASTPVSGSPPPSPGCSPAANWVLQLLAVLHACCGRREVLSLLATCLNLLQRAVAAAVRAASATGTSGQQRQQALEDSMAAAQQGWQQRSGVQPALLFSLLSAHGASLAAADISVKLLPMLTGGVWRLQQPWQQQAARHTLAGQLHLAAELLALPGASPQQWLTKMSEQQGASHWVVAMLQQQAAVLAARAGSAGPASVASSLQAAAQQLQAAGQLLESFAQRAEQAQAAAKTGAEPGSAGGGGPAAAAAAAQPGKPAAAASSALSLLLAPAPQAGSEAAPWEPALLAAVQHSLAPAALPAVLKQLASRGSSTSGSLSLQNQLAALAPDAAQALLSDPQQAYASLQKLRPHLPAAGSSSPAAAPWQLALALFASASGLGTHASGLSLLKLSSVEAMAAAVAATTPTTARCAWLLLRLLLDEHQWQGGHRLAEAEKVLAQRAAQQAILRPTAASALAATLCGLSPSAAAGQQLLHELEALLRVPVVDLARQAAAAPASSWHRQRATASAALPASSADVLPVAAPPFGAEQGVADAALVCLSSGSSGERQHAFAQQLIRQLAALADLLQQQQQQQQQAQAVPAPPLECSTASHAAAQVSVWLRLSLLLPLLPLVYKHRAADSSGGLRGQLLLALLRLLAAPAINADASLPAADAPACQTAAAAAAAAAAAGEPLSQRLLHLLRALLVGGWASWMRLQGGKLRDVPPYEHSRQLAADAAALPLPPALHAAVAGALPLALQQGLMAVPSCHAVAAAAPAQHGEQPPDGSSTLALDPWLLLEGGSAVPGSGGEAPAAAGTLSAAAEVQAAVPPWLEGAVKRRRRDLRYMPGPDACEAPPRSLEEQLGM